MRIEKYFLRGDVSKSIADSDLKLSHDLDKSMKMQMPKFQAGIMFSFSVLTLICT